jgi:hypothetical protein
VKISMKLRVPENVEKSLTRFSGRTLFSRDSLSCTLWSDHKPSFICCTGYSGVHYLLAGCFQVGPVGSTFANRIKYLAAEQRKFVNITITK